MNSKDHLISTFNERVFKESYVRIYKCLTLLDEKQLWDSPSGNVPAIGCLILHLSGNARQWILSGLGGEKDNRVRDDEFLIHRNIRKSELVFLLENLKVQLRNCLNNLDASLLDKELVIQGFKVTGFAIIIHVLEHFSYHTGQITLLTKLYSNKETDYYSGLDLNKNNRLN
ncbi:MAG: DUF1572 domain-containing protein [Crocinitomicaceae bacterium]|nr:DUF1572 domain-containing protein [Crocinitomicaceae bacterium]